MNNLGQVSEALALDSIERFEHYLSNDNKVDLHNLKKARILLIEDDRTTRRMVSQEIGAYCNVIEAFNAGTGVAKYKSCEPDIVFLDLELPDSNGHKVLEWIMHNDPGAHVVLFSGHCDRDNIEKAMESGAKGFVPKPFDADFMMYHILQCAKLH